MRTNLVSILTAGMALLTIGAAQKTAAAQTSSTPQILESGSAPTSSSQTSTLVSEQAPASQPASPTTYHSKQSETYLYHLGAFAAQVRALHLHLPSQRQGAEPGLLCPCLSLSKWGLWRPKRTVAIFPDTSVGQQYPAYPIVVQVSADGHRRYSRLFETGHALDYGLALALPPFSKSLRVELRDYWTFANPTQHNVVLRVGWMGEESD
jgi:hypothetical protein